MAPRMERRTELAGVGGRVGVAPTVFVAGAEVVARVERTKRRGRVESTTAKKRKEEKEKGGKGRGQQQQQQESEQQ